MGQLVGVARRPGAAPGIVRFELNRTLSGQGHERFISVDDADGDRPSAVLARRLLGTGQVDSVHIYANIVTIDVSKGADDAGLDEVIAEMYRYWLPGVEPPTFEDLEPETAAPAPAGDASDGDPWAAAAALVPVHLLERSKAARERWAAKAG